MGVEFYRCKNIWIKAPGHPCWRVQKALDEQGVDYEIVPGPWPGRGQRDEMERLSGQPKYPIKAGTLFEKQGAGQPTV